MANLEKFTHTFGDIILQGIDVFGDFKFTFKGNQAGIYVDPLTA